MPDILDRKITSTQGAVVLSSYNTDIMEDIVLSRLTWIVSTPPPIKVKKKVFICGDHFYFSHSLKHNFSNFINHFVKFGVFIYHVHYQVTKF